MRSTFLYRYIALRKLQVPVWCTRSTADTLLVSERRITLQSQSGPVSRGRTACWDLKSARVPCLCADSRGLCSLRGPAEAAQLGLQSCPPSSYFSPFRANLLRSRGEPGKRRLAVGIQGRDARPCEVPCPLSGRLFGCYRHLMATRVEEATRGRGGSAEEATEAGEEGRRRSLQQKVSLGGVGVVAEPGECSG